MVQPMERKASYSGILIGSYSTQDIQNWVISGAASGTVTVTGSVNVVVMDQTTDSYIDEGANLKYRWRLDGMLQLMIQAYKTVLVQQEHPAPYP